MTHTQAKCQGQRSFGLKVRVETDGRTDGRGRMHYLACCYNAVGNDEY